MKSLHKQINNTFSWTKIYNCRCSQIICATVTLKCDQGHKKWYEQVKFINYYYWPKLNFYQMQSAQENTMLTKAKKKSQRNAMLRQQRKDSSLETWKYANISIYRFYLVVLSIIIQRNKLLQIHFNLNLTLATHPTLFMMSKTQTAKQNTAAHSHAFYNFEAFVFNKQDQYPTEKLQCVNFYFSFQFYQ